MDLIITKIKEGVKQYKKEGFLAICLLLTVAIGYNIGEIYRNNHEGTPSEESAAIANQTKAETTQKKPAITATPKDSRVVASKASSSKLYHYTYCGGAKQIKETNKIYFASAAAAEAAGYSLAGNCNP